MKLFTRVSDIAKTYGPLKVPAVALAQSRWFLMKNVLKRRYMCRNIFGRKMYLDLQHKGVSRTLAVWGIREADHTELFRREIKEGMVVVDIGANIGYYTLMAASLVGETGKVFAIEPDPRNYEMLRMSIAANGFSDRVEMHCLAISNKTGKAKFHMADATNLNTTFSPQKHNMSDHIHVTDVVDIETISLDDFLKDKSGIYVIRMDIEGYEVEALEGMLNTLKSAASPCKLIFETHAYAYDEGHNLRTVLPKIVDFGYTIKTIVSAGQARPPLFEQFGYEPVEVVRDGEYTRGFYTNVSLDHTIELIHAKPKCIRYVLLVR